MAFTKARLGVFILFCCSVSTFGQMTSPPPAKTPGEALNVSLGLVEQQFVPAADAMPADKYDFAPTNGEFKGVRTFALEVRHVATANYMFGSMVLAEKPPVELGDENGPAALKSKAEIMKFLNDSFAYLHKALTSINEKNELEQLDSPFGMKASRLSFASFSIAHPLDHYGQMVEYLRMNGIVPPASRPQNK
ncbi:MAG: DinB family protein [Acidobacteria bacterium]|nr:DinB family protein [Acidobacteriota bacterium]